MKFINKNKFNLNEFKISPEEFFAKKKEHPKPVVLDIRELDDSSRGTAEGAHCLPADYLEDRLIQLPPFGTIILYSDSMNNSIERCMLLLWENGFTDILFVDGGYEGIMDELVTTTPEADARFQECLKAASAQGVGFEICIKGLDYWLEAVDKEPDPKEYLTIKKKSGVFFLARRNLRRAEETSVDYKDGKLVADHPRMHLPRPEGSLRDRINQVLDTHINPSIASHGGIITLIDVKDDTMYIEMGGGCQGCGMSKVTLKQGVETVIKDNVPEIEFIYDTTDHASGTNPYYQPESGADW